MAIKKSAVMLGQQPFPVPHDSGDLREVVIKWDTTATADGVIANGDYLQLCQLPANAQLSEVQLFSSATFGATTTFAAGIATSSTASTNATTLIAATNLTTTVVEATRIVIQTVAPLAAPTADENIVGILVAGADTSASIKLYAVIRYRAARYGY